MNTPIKLNKNAPIFNFFDQVDYEDGHYKCKSCNCIVKMYNSTTSNLRKHLILTRPEIHYRIADSIRYRIQNKHDCCS